MTERQRESNMGSKKYLVQSDGELLVGQKGQKSPRGNSDSHILSLRREAFGDGSLPFKNNKQKTWIH